jgi:hypothetical protein
MEHQSHLKRVVTNRTILNIWKTLILWKGASIGWTIGQGSTGHPINVMIELLV